MGFVSIFRPGRALVPVVILSLGWGAPASARLNGVISSNCASCHGGGREPAVTISIDPLLVDVGGTATITVRIAAETVAGFYLNTYGLGTFREIAGQGARLVTPTDVVHSAPKPATGGQVTFQVAWTAPATRGTVDFEAWAVAANGDRASGGDAAGQGRRSVAIGCPGIELFVDADGDGYGSTEAPKEQVCEGTPKFAAQAGDCDDFLATVHPGAAERCNNRDDDCNGQVDEGLDTVTMYRDADGDGYGQRSSTDTHQGCSSSGYAPNQDDCDDGDKTVHPGAKEICNNLDDDCNGRIDEGARSTCALGWCQRYAETCDTKTCFPGPPRAEECNLYDDDCDGVIDNAARCDAGKVCFAGRCLASDDAKAAAEARTPMSSDGGVADSGPASSAPSDAGAPPRALRTASACAYGGAGEPGACGGAGELAWPALFLMLAILLRKARTRSPLPRPPAVG